MHSKAIVYTSIISAAVSVLFLLFKRRYRAKNIGPVKKLIIYPVKSLPGIEVTRLQVAENGLQYNQWIDRGFVIITDKNDVLTARQIPSLILLKLSFNGDELWIKSPNGSVLKIKYMDNLNNDSKVVEAKYGRWEKMTGIDCGDEAAEWIQSYLDRDGYRLLRHVSSLPLRSSFEWTGDTIIFNREKPMVFHDGNPIHVINDASIADLNQRLTSGSNVTYKNFRPNILVECEAYSEDNWVELRINNTLLKKQNKVERCVFTQINPETAERSEEPLKTLKEYRCGKTEAEKKYYGNKPLFGVSLCMKRSGFISIDDNVLARF